MCTVSLVTLSVILSVFGVVLASCWRLRLRVLHAKLQAAATGEEFRSVAASSDHVERSRCAQSHARHHADLVGV
jgi:hypothetical protein